MAIDQLNHNALTQQQLLNLTMVELGLTREQLGRRLCVAAHTIDRWLLPSDDQNARAMPETGMIYIREFLETQRMRSNATCV
ncbi:hypothetical protein [Paraburkholderia atlantica]|uniref:Uncharacterized protein n=1 Tax=Paraburkholderia atlantica TaxID=2654982 RepID=D5WNA8_PARAM|nr:hypothetical protein [Paraburkholderia atlantica]ADG20787.1 hypothetical protein BC1002_7003 [Paraburkholderia atlantica]MBB5510071.1 hypothetical protein [Paraburkholderia atlantica]